MIHSVRKVALLALGSALLLSAPTFALEGVVADPCLKDGGFSQRTWDDYVNYILQNKGAYATVAQRLAEKSSSRSVTDEEDLFQQAVFAMLAKPPEKWATLPENELRNILFLQARGRMIDYLKGEGRTSIGSPRYLFRAWRIFSKVAELLTEISPSWKMIIQSQSPVRRRIYQLMELAVMDLLGNASSERLQKEFSEKDLVFLRNYVGKAKDWELKHYLFSNPSYLGKPEDAEVWEKLGGWVSIESLADRSIKPTRLAHATYEVPVSPKSDSDKLRAVLDEWSWIVQRQGEVLSISVPVSSDFLILVANAGVSQRYQIAAVLQYAAGMPHRQIAILLGVSESMISRMQNDSRPKAQRGILRARGFQRVEGSQVSGERN